MSHFYRKTAPGVRNGRVQKQNNWALSPSVYRNTQTCLVIDRRKPGEGYRHLLLKRDIERFVALIPNWDALAVGLDLISLDCGRHGCDGWYNRGALGICAWPKEMSYVLDTVWFAEHRRFLERIGARVEEGGIGRDIVIHWTDATARAYQLCHVFLHELGHHADRMHTHAKKDNAPRGEGFAEDYAFDLEREVLERYFAEFGFPE
ncbi:Uncharacterized protein OS=Dysgonomonas gadei ATCC BAA-286 GN=HMPREF9455_01415 PE=4 SV=1 [Gemmata massiliana]|uniref:Uncharacterized protein n=1 Tax=Gemmata massiliana TaxID=1210884 RepID=A0A6P2CVL9_9BACT|nr:hypothetical protein [Gemmata massiliana]VTR92205.1 Uncharacterized protein OS=Dysgonomonas gadei ATCC BAA-286 GN=HMPREF9455_01415 PE=4 SV=1 [Gemmata massiliana]